MSEPGTFQQLAETARQIAETGDVRVKIALCAACLRSFHADRELRLAARFLAEGAFPPLSAKRIAIGSRTYSTCAAHFCEIDYEKVFKPCREATGSAPEAIEKLMRNIESARLKRRPAGLTLLDIEQYYDKLSRVSSRADKQQILRTAWEKMTPAEINYFIRIMKGAPRIGLSTRNIISAVAEAFDRDAAAVHYTYTITGSMGRTALLSKQDNLERARFSLFHPLPFMLASPLGDGSTGDLPGSYLAEEEFDGLRAQAHVSGKRLRLYSRDHSDITADFPEIREFFASRNLPDTVLDGAICVFRDHEILPSQLLRKRVKDQRTNPGMIEKYPVLFINFDILFYNGGLISGEPLVRRRRVLDKMAETYRLPVARQSEAGERNRIEKLLARSLAHGNRGLVLKKTDSSYAFGQCSDSWLKIKGPGGTLTAVLMYAHHAEGGGGGGRRGRGGKAGRDDYSDFTLGIRVTDDERYEEEFIPIGKAPGTNIGEEQFSRLRERVKELAVETYGPTTGLVPEIVIELEFRDIQLNRRTKANYMLRRPRFKAIRWEAGPADADTLERVERLYRKKLNRERLKQHKNPSFTYNYP